eukprot:4028389-Lingulodinium_polyedra.AAC.1
MAKPAPIAVAETAALELAGVDAACRGFWNLSGTRGPRLRNTWNRPAAPGPAASQSVNAAGW